MTRLVDLSHPLEDGMGAYPGPPPARIGAILDHDASRERSIDLADAQLEAAAGRAVLVRTGWDGRWGADDYWTDGPFLTAGFAFSAAPLAIRDGATVPVQAYAEVPS